MEQFLMTTDDAVFYLKSCCVNSKGLIPHSFGGYYCGVTNDIKRREGEHNASFLGYVTAKTVNGALQLEARMHKEGFDTGGQLGNAGDDSKFVYVYKKGPDTIE